MDNDELGRKEDASVVLFRAEEIGTKTVDSKGRWLKMWLESEKSEPSLGFIWYFIFK